MHGSSGTVKHLWFILIITLTPPLWAQEAWLDIKDVLFENRPLTPAGRMILAEVPTRTPNDLRTHLSAFVQAPPNEYLGKIWLIIDNNPMPVSAVFDLDRPLPWFYFDTTMRINMQSPVHIVFETTSGALYVAQYHVKTSGTGACAAPPGTDPEKALATLGQMDLGITSLNPSDIRAKRQARNNARLDIHLNHPSHSGLQKDQITLLFIPFRYVEHLDIKLDDMPYVRVEGSISLSENPQISISIPQTATNVTVSLQDTEGTKTNAQMVAMYK